MGSLRIEPSGIETDFDNSVLNPYPYFELNRVELKQGVSDPVAVASVQLRIEPSGIETR